MAVLANDNGAPRRLRDLLTPLVFNGVEGGRTPPLELARPREHMKLLASLAP
jgi:hypothetical protein